MGNPAQKLRRATYADLEAVPPHLVAELIRGTLHTFPRPAPAHAQASSALGVELGGPFDRGRGGPGGWRILDEPELHLGDDVVVPDLAGWRRERMPRLPAESFFTLAPDWICEVLSPGTAAHDRAEKMPLYAAAGVSHAWLVDPVARTVEVYVLLGEGARRGWLLLGVHRDSARVRAEPFDAIEIDLAGLWEG
ncbi:MAG TPA: Uma2 family endonuclease [Candidatus Nanopelagicales bacterium]|nr:Uma2 family endonuclease [Candidatus Nanopelagicales bacterium]